MKLILPISIVLFGVAIEAPWAMADYTLELTNGRRITVQSYREDNGIIKFSGIGGEIGISKDAIRAIRQADGTDSDALNIRQLEATPASKREAAKEKVPVPDDSRAKEEKAYQDKMRELTGQLKSARDQYSEAIRGTTSPDPTLLTTDEQIKARQSDANSRFKNAQYNPSEPVPVRLAVPSPFSSMPPTVEAVPPAAFPPALAGAPAYTPKEKELADMRERTLGLEKERERLINEMRQKNLNTGSLFLE